MTIRDWLATRAPAPPDALRVRIDRAVERARDEDASAPAAACLAASERVLRELFAEPLGGRAAAVDLLAADALVTYAFEAASEDPDTLDATAARAMSRLSRLASDKG